MTQDYHRVAVVGKYAVPAGYTLIDAKDKQGSVAYALQGELLIVDAKRGPTRLEECMLSIARRQVDHYTAMIAELQVDAGPLDLKSTVIDFQFFTGYFDLSLGGVLNAIHMLERSVAQEHTITNGELLSYMEKLLDLSKEEVGSANTAPE